MEPYRVPVTEGDRIRADAALSLSALAFAVPTAEMIRRERVRPRTAGAACRWAEDERDRADYDALMDGLEGALRAVMQLPLVDLAPDTGGRR